MLKIQQSAPTTLTFTGNLAVNDQYIGVCCDLHAWTVSEIDTDLITGRCANCEKELTLSEEELQEDLSLLYCESQGIKPFPMTWEGEEPCSS